MKDTIYQRVLAKQQTNKAIFKEIPKLIQSENLEIASLFSLEPMTKSKGFGQLELPSGPIKTILSISSNSRERR